MILEQDENSKKSNRLSISLCYIIFEIMRIMTKYCIIREIYINILKIHVHSEPVLS